MPSAKVDFVWDWDFLNVTVTRSQGAPKVTPAWKGRTAPKLPPKPKALPASSTPRPPLRPKINATRFQTFSDEYTPRITDVTETEDTNRALKPTSGNPKKNIPKLKNSGAAKAKAVSNAASTPNAVKNTAKAQANRAQ